MNNNFDAYVLSKDTNKLVLLHEKSQLQTCWSDVEKGINKALCYIINGLSRQDGKILWKLARWSFIILGLNDTLLSYHAVLLVYWCVEFARYWRKRQKIHLQFQNFHPNKKTFHRWMCSNCRICRVETDEKRYIDEKHKHGDGYYNNYLMWFEILFQI